MTISRRALLGSAAALPLFAINTRPARAAEFTFKYANNTPVTHPLTLRMQEAADRILKGTDGRVEIQLFPNNQLGSDTDMLSQLRSGALELFTLSGLILSTLVPPASINGVGFAFKDYDQVWAAMDGKLGGFVRAEIAKRGLLPMEYMFDNGFRPDHDQRQADRGAGRLQGGEAAGATQPAVDQHVRGAGRVAGDDQLRRDVFRAADPHRGRPGEPAQPDRRRRSCTRCRSTAAITNHMWDGFWLLANQAAPSTEAAARRRRPWSPGSTQGGRAGGARTTSPGRTRTCAGQLAKGAGSSDQRRATPRQFQRGAEVRPASIEDWRGKYGDEAWARAGGCGRPGVVAGAGRAPGGAIAGRRRAG